MLFMRFTPSAALLLGLAAGGLTAAHAAPRISLVNSTGATLKLRPQLLKGDTGDVRTGARMTLQVHTRDSEDRITSVEVDFNATEAPEIVIGPHGSALFEHGWGALARTVEVRFVATSCDWSTFNESLGYRATYGALPADTPEVALDCRFDPARFRVNASQMSYVSLQSKEPACAIL